MSQALQLGLGRNPINPSRHNEWIVFILNYIKNTFSFLFFSFVRTNFFIFQIGNN